MNRGFESVCDLKLSLLRIPHGTTSFLPTIMTRLSPFFPISKQQINTDTITEPIIIENPWGKITVTDTRLSVYDETVLLSLLMLLKKYNSNTFQTTPYELFKLMNIKPARILTMPS